MQLQGREREGTRPRLSEAEWASSRDGRLHNSDPHDRRRPGASPVRVRHQERGGQGGHPGVGPDQAGRSRYRNSAAHWRPHLPGHGARRPASLRRGCTPPPGPAPRAGRQRDVRRGLGGVAGWQAQGARQLRQYPRAARPQLAAARAEGRRARPADGRALRNGVRADRHVQRGDRGGARGRAQARAAGRCPRADQVHRRRHPAPHLRRLAQVPERPVEAGTQDPVQPDLHGRAGN